MLRIGSRCIEFRTNDASSPRRCRRRRNVIPGETVRKRTSGVRVTRPVCPVTLEPAADRQNIRNNKTIRN